MISNTLAWPGSGVTGQGSDFSAPPAYIRASRTELAAVGGSLGSVGGEEGRAEQSSRFSGGSVQSGGVGELNGAQVSLEAVSPGKVKRRSSSQS